MSTVTQSLTDILASHIANRDLTWQVLGQALTHTFGGSDAEGKWNWKLAYDLMEASLVKYLRSRAPENLTLQWLEELSKSLPTQTRRSEEQIKFQQFSTPVSLAYIMAQACRLTDEDVLLESSAGTGLLAVWGQMAGSKLILNEYAPTRQKILGKLFPDAPLFRFNGEQIHDFLPKEHQPSVVLINPPFTASPNFDKTHRQATERHLHSALMRLRPGGRMVALTSESFTPTRWRDTFIRWSEVATLQMAIAIPAKVYSKMGTSYPTQMLVFDKIPGELDLNACHQADSVEMALLLLENLPPRAKLGEAIPILDAPNPLQATAKTSKRFVPGSDLGTIIEVNYSTHEWNPRQFSEGIYEPYQLQTINIPDAVEHPCALVQSSAMASISSPIPSYVPNLPERTLEEGQLSNAQLETIIFAGQAHQHYLPGKYKLDKHQDLVKTLENDPEGKSYRQGYFIGDGTGVGKGREIFGIILDNCLKNQKKAIFVTISPKLIEDARRDWAVLGGRPEQIIPLTQFKQGEEINLSQGIIFTTYATLRQGAKANKISRVDQLINWVGSDFEGCLIFDESHALSNASDKVDEQGFGVVEASDQGLAGLEIQRKLPNARVVYSSATGFTEVRNFAYSERLGLWMGNGDFKSREDFITSMTEGGICAMEIIARDLKAMGLYCARSLSYEGVEYDVLEHHLSESQVAIYNQYAQAYQVILSNLHRALRVALV